MLAAALALALVAAEPRLELDATAGAGYDSNLSHDPSSAGVGSPLLTASGAAGVSDRFGRLLRAYAGGRLTGTEVLDVSDLSRVRAQAEVSVSANPGRFSVFAGGAGGRAWWRDDARDAWLLSGTAGASFRPWPRATLGVRYERSRDDARDSVYSTTRDQLVLRVGLRLAPAVRARVSYAWTWGDEVLYPMTSASATPLVASAMLRGGTRRTPGGGPVTTSFPGAERAVVRTPALTGTARAGIELALSRHTYVDVEGAFAHVDGDAGSYDALSAFAVFGVWR